MHDGEIYILLFQMFNPISFILNLILEGTNSFSSQRSFQKQHTFLLKVQRL